MKAITALVQSHGQKEYSVLHYINCIILVQCVQ